MTIAACAALVEAGDPDRFAATMTVDPALRGPLFVLYALNLEVAKAPWVTTEPMIAEMRLQWWRDVVEEAGAGKPARAHEVAGPLADIVMRHDLARLLDQMIAARRWDIYKDPFEDQAHMDSYLDQTSGNLMWAAALTCGAGPGVEQAVRDAGYAHGVASFLRAVPQLVEKGRVPLLDGRDAGVRALAQGAYDRLRRAGTTGLGAAVPAARVAWQAQGILRQAIAEPGRVADGALGLSEFGKRSLLVWKTVTRRW